MILVVDGAGRAGRTNPVGLFGQRACFVLRG
jgi:hypothetical protein